MIVVNPNCASRLRNAVSGKLQLSHQFEHKLVFTKRWQERLYSAWNVRMIGIHRSNAAEGEKVSPFITGAT